MRKIIDGSYYCEHLLRQFYTHTFIGVHVQKCAEKREIKCRDIECYEFDHVRINVLNLS